MVINVIFLIKADELTWQSLAKNWRDGRIFALICNMVFVSPDWLLCYDRPDCGDLLETVKVRLGLSSISPRMKPPNVVISKSGSARCKFDREGAPHSARLAFTYFQRGWGGTAMALDSRLRALQSEVARINECIAGIQESMVKKTDVTTQKIWMLVGSRSAIVVRAAAICVANRALFDLCGIFATQVIFYSLGKKILLGGADCSNRATCTDQMEKQGRFALPFYETNVEKISSTCHAHLPD